ncbi:uncharacterized protein LOC114189816 [Vigna unguiculata]|uniref:uncharacterized protein LOC114189816 n=1 Tax=Vigna unguiculata TaxID=3917 RepID=UPI001016C7A2|nr:uncharacterized protein LOC114189816 [Vigna unguiculata]XP_027934317.1 uncharacterized protein LOC114189816 [Vigna unguiculata]XP_027934318.1 uncharacterized protein LOC114189816 [Vigna unguiculata]
MKKSFSFILFFSPFLPSFANPHHSCIASLPAVPTLFSISFRFLLYEIENMLKMKFLDWYLKIGFVSALVGASMEVFMIKTGFYDKVTVLESEKRAWENSPDAQAIREALNPWRHIEAEETKKS